MRIQKIILKKELILLLLLPLNVLAKLPPSPRMQISGSGVTHHLGAITGDAMMPLTGSSNSFLFVDVMGGYASNATYLISPGNGIRTLLNNQVFGAYFFGDYEQTRLGANFWNLSPGIEWITPHWDAHLNGYFPTRTHKVIGAVESASTLSSGNYSTFTPGTHNQYDNLLAPYAVIGNGGDIELGYSLDKKENALRSRIYIGGYHYQTPNNGATVNANIHNITGITVGFSHALAKNWTVAVFNSSDQVSEYNVGASLTLTFGGESNLFSKNVRTRLLDSVERHVGIIATGAGNYDQKYWQAQGMGLTYDNIYFIAENGTGNGTYGNPMSLNQTNLDAITAQSPNGSRLYLQGGTNAVYTVDSTSTTNSMGLSVYNGQDFYGRSADYRTAAISELQPRISVDGLNGYNGFISQGGENTFSNINIFSSTLGYGSGIIATNTAQSTATLTINNTTLSQFTTGVYAINANNGTFILNTNNSHFDNNTQMGGGAAAYGMNLFNTGSGDFIINAHSSSFNNNTSSGDTNQAVGLSVYNAGSGNITTNLNDSTFNNNSAIGGNAPIAAGFYCYNNGNGVLAINTLNSQFNANFASNQAFGLEAINRSSGNIYVTNHNSQFENNNSDNILSAGLAAGNYGSGTITLDSQHSSFIAGDSANSYLIYTYNAGSGTINTLIR